MPPQSSDAVAQWFADNFDVAGGLLYEMFGLTDNFWQNHEAESNGLSFPLTLSFANRASGNTDSVVFRTS